MTTCHKVSRQERNLLLRRLHHHCRLHYDELRRHEKFQFIEVNRKGLEQRIEVQKHVFVEVPALASLYRIDNGEIIRALEILEIGKFLIFDESMSCLLFVEMGKESMELRF